MLVDLLGLDNRIFNQIGSVEISLRERDGGNLMIVVGRVIENALLEIVAGAIDSVFVFLVAKIAATVLLFDRVENMEELADARRFVVGG